MTNPITAFFKELWRDRGRDRDKERLESMQSNNRALAAAVLWIQSNNKELESTASALELTASALESNNKELSSAVSRMELALKLKKEKLNKAMPNPDRYFNVRMSPELAEQLNELADQNNMTRAEVFRRAIGLYKLAKSITNKKGKVLLESNDQVTRELVGI